MFGGSDGITRVLVCGSGIGSAEISVLCSLLIVESSLSILKAVASRCTGVTSCDVWLLTLLQRLVCCLNIFCNSTISSCNKSSRCSILITLLTVRSEL